MQEARRSFMRQVAGLGSFLIESFHGEDSCAGSSVIPAQIQGAARQERDNRLSSGGGVPAWVPPPGTFAEFTTNTPRSVGAIPAVLANWCGGTFVNDYGAKGAAVYHGGGEHYTWPDKGGTLVLDCDRREFVMRNLSSVATHMGSDGTNGSPVNEYGCYADNDYPQSKHTYNGLAEMPEAWGGGPDGSLVMLAKSGGLLLAQVDGRGAGWSSTYRFDLSQPIDGHTRLTGDQWYNFGNGKRSSVNDAIGCGIDRLREGWWCFARQNFGWGERMCFTHKSGRVDSAATPPLGLDWGTLHHFEDDDTLCAITGGKPRKVVICHPGQPWKAVNLSVSAADSVYLNDDSVWLGYIGFKWSKLLQCFIGLDYHSQPGGTSTMLVWKIIPPAGAARWNSGWVVQREDVVSADGSQINVRSDSGTLQGTWGKFNECEKLRAFVYTRRVDKPGQLVRLRGM